jgi:putative glycosyltransferase (TIGR04372 family)
MLSIAYKLIRRILRSCIDSSFRDDWGFCHPPAGWHESVSPILARQIYWLFKPLAQYLRAKNYLFSINNISTSTGHVYAELDYALRQQHLGIIPPECIVIFLWPRSPIANGFNQAILPHNFKLILNGLGHIFIYPLLLRYKYLSFDSGLSDTNHGLGYTAADRLSYRSLYEKYRSYFYLIGLCPEYYPIRGFQPDGMPKKLASFIGTERYVVLQIKDTAGNASFKPTDPESYLSAISHMQDSGVTVVFAGREKMPTKFAQLGVLDYANSNLATPINDFHLVRSARAVLSSGSGFSMIAGSLGVPLLIVNVWNYLWSGSRYTLVIPSVLSVSETDLTVDAQIALTMDVGQNLPFTKTEKAINCIDASSDQILEGWQELVADIESGDWSDSPLQQKFRHALGSAAVSVAQSRVADSFLRRNLHLY